MWYFHFISILFKTTRHIKLPLAPFGGNHFNILFYDGPGVYYLQCHMIEYLQKVHGKNANRLLESVLKDLMNPMLIGACRALGLIDKIVTGPLWRRLEESSISVLEMGYTHCQLKVLSAIFYFHKTILI